MSVMSCGTVIDTSAGVTILLVGSSFAAATELHYILFELYKPFIPADEDSFTSYSSIVSNFGYNCLFTLALRDDGFLNSTYVMYSLSSVLSISSESTLVTSAIDYRRESPWLDEEDSSAF